LPEKTNRINRDQSIKHRLKIARWKFRRTVVSRRWGGENMAVVPAVLGNAMPKSGSHLIIQVLQGLTKIGPFVNPGFPPVNRTEDNQQISDEGILKVLSQMRSGDIGYGYLQAKKIFVQALTRQGMASIFVYRDPRDMIVSHVFYATEIFPDHGMHRYYTESLTTMEERINAAIGGVTKSELKLKSIRARYDVYKDWLAQPEVLCIRFEDLRLEQDNAFNRILDFLEEHGFQVKISRQRAIEMLGEAITPQKSGTFRKGKPGSWREHFTQKNIDFFKQSTGDLLVDLGYENNNEWSIDRF